jgi:hypothetical protein
LRLHNPVQHESLGSAHGVSGAGILKGSPSAINGAAIDTDDDTLRPRDLRNFVDQVRPFQRRRIDRDLVSTVLKARNRLCARPDPASDGDWDVQCARHIREPSVIDGAALDRRSDVIDNDFIGALVAVSARKFGRVANVRMPLKAHALYDATSFNIEARNDALRWQELPPA